MQTADQFGHSELFDNAKPEDAIKALADGNTRMVSLHKPGSSTIHKGKRHTVGKNGKWKRKQERKRSKKAAYNKKRRNKK